MKIFARSALLLSALFCLLGAESIDQEIARIASAPPKERVALMNALKRRLFQLNEAERLKAIERLRASMNAGAQRRAQAGGEGPRPPHTPPPLRPSGSETMERPAPYRPTAGTASPQRPVPQQPTPASSQGGHPESTRPAHTAAPSRPPNATPEHGHRGRR
ncbi:MAG: hypothetical protein GXO33_05645 [Epsilonproteobacteria bacterium]|nr:hypothetical protein [Campylobacterota bacterium]